MYSSPDSTTNTELFYDFFQPDLCSIDTACLLKYEFLKKSFNHECNFDLCQMIISSHLFFASLLKIKNSTQIMTRNGQLTKVYS